MEVDLHVIGKQAPCDGGGACSFHFDDVSDVGDTRGFQQSVGGGGAPDPQASREVHIGVFVVSRRVGRGSDHQTSFEQIGSGSGGPQRDDAFLCDKQQRSGGAVIADNKDGFAPSLIIQLVNGELPPRGGRVDPDLVGGGREPHHRAVIGPAACGGGRTHPIR